MPYSLLHCGFVAKTEANVPGIVNVNGSPKSEQTYENLSDTINAVNNMSVPLEHTRSLPGALVTGADYRGLGVVRSLGRRGIPVWVLRYGDQRLASFSKYATRVFDWQGDNPKTHINYLVDLAEKHNLEGWVLFPTDDYAVSAISQHHECLAKKFRMTIPPWSELQC